jgi:putative CocE/NonD family hydrolase
MFRKPLFLVLALIVPAGGWTQTTAPSSAAPQVEKISRFGQYTGFSEAKYDSFVRISQYLTMRDGVKIAIDIIRPAADGKAVAEKLPVVWTHNRYRRAFKAGNRVISIVDSPDIRNLVRHGYVAASADARGSGASFGKALGIFWKEETRDAYEITEWLARQPWSNGRVGMFGGSYLGITQLMAASTRPPHLKAIFPTVALFDLYEIVCQGGVFKEDFVKTWSDLIMIIDTEQVAAPVDDDKDGKLLAKAVAEHKAGNRPLLSIVSGLRFRNSRDGVTGTIPNLEWQPAAFVKEINEAGIPTYIVGGWYDGFTRHSFLMFRNFTVPRKLTVGAWSHSPKDAEIAKEEFSLIAVEELRWFDYWLKGIDNGIMAEPSVTYQVMFEPKKNIWKTAAEWPLPESVPTPYYFDSGRSGSVASTNDGRLVKTAPGASGTKDDYHVDYATTSGTTTRWDNTVGEGFGYPDRTPQDVKSLTYTTERLKTEVEVTGFPVVHLWVSSTATDGDFFAYLEEVTAEGAARYVTEGCLRASLRTMSAAPYDNLGLPYHQAFDTDIGPLQPGEPVELVFSLEPTSIVFNKDHRIRLTIACADADNAATPRLDPAPTISIYRDKDKASFVSLPVVPKPEGTAASSSFFIYFILALVLVLVVAFAYYVQARMRKK